MDMRSNIGRVKRKDQEVGKNITLILLRKAHGRN